MSMAIGHFALGATITFFLLIVVKAYRFPGLWLLGIFSGVWAMMPDIWRVTPIPKNIIHDSIVSNLFWMHPAIDKLDSGDSMYFSAALFGGFLFMATIYGVKSYRYYRKALR